MTRHPGYRYHYALRQDGEPLRTKIVATLGDPALYPDDLVRVDGSRVPKDELTYQALVEAFYTAGVDVIRLNLSHLATPQRAREVYREVKRAIRDCERANDNLKKLSILADLPGPKIRFDIRDELELRPGERLTVVFDRIVSSAREQAVYIDDKPLRTTLDDIDRIRDELGYHADENDPDSGESHAKISDNILGYSTDGSEHRPRLFEKMMHKISARLAQGRALVFVGDADAILEVDGAAFDPHKAELACTVLTAKRPLRGRKGFTLKGIDIDIPTFNKLDQTLLDALLEEEHAGDDPEPVCAFIALSFAQTADDLLRAKEMIEKKLVEVGVASAQSRLESPALIAKIETNKGWKNRHFILDVADGVMVARGDLGLQMDIEEVPDIQKRLIKLCNQRGKPVITATQMLSSMTSSMEPTRAEVTDVFNAIQDGTDAVMMSEETAIGHFPLHAVDKMVSIARRAEYFYELKSVSNEEMRKDLRRQRIADALKNDTSRIKTNQRRIESALYYVSKGWRLMRGDESKQIERLEWRRRLYRAKRDRTNHQEVMNRITESAISIAEATGVSALLIASTSGRTVRMIARLRARVPILGITHDLVNARKLALSYGVIPLLIPRIDPVEAEQRNDSLFISCRRAIHEHPLLRAMLTGKTVIFTCGFPVQQQGTTNTLQIRKVEPV